MKRKRYLLLALSILLLFIQPAGAAASDIQGPPEEELLDQLTIFDRDNTIVFNKSTWVQWDSRVKSIKPEIKDSVLFVPMRQAVSLWGGTFKYDGKATEATAVVNGRTVTAKLGSNELKAGGSKILMESNAQFIKGYLNIPIKGLAEAAGMKAYNDSTGLTVLYDASKKVEIKALKEICADIDKYFSTKPMDFKTVDLKISTGTKKVNVITINPKHPQIKITADLPDTRLNNTRNFEVMAKAKNAAAAVNANFISGYGPVKDPVGNLMINGKLVYGQSGITNIGFTKNREIVFANPGTFATGSADGKKENIAQGVGKFEYNHWACYEINTLSQNQSNNILYTPERGDKIDITSVGYVAVVRNGIVVSNKLMAPGTSVNIPKDGYVVYIGKAEGDKWKANLSLAVGRKVDYECTIRNNNNEAFKWEDMDYVIAGGPDLVLDGEIQPQTTNPIFTGAKFTTLSAYRTAIGVTKDGMLLLVSVPNVKISELKEIMKGLGAWNAVNFDGGASSGMYYNGKVITKPGRELCTVLYVTME